MGETRLKDFCGQRCDVVIAVVDSDRTLVRFESERGYGFPSLDLSELETLIAKVRAFRELVQT